jgi:hypothetical protein
MRGKNIAVGHTKPRQRMIQRARSPEVSCHLFVRRLDVVQAGMFKGEFTRGPTVLCRRPQRHVRRCGTARV